jgi:hypothetical protein
MENWNALGIWQGRLTAAKSVTLLAGGAGLRLPPARRLCRFAPHARGAAMPEPTITCPTCATAIPLTESLAAPLIAATRRDYEAKLATARAEAAAEEAVKARASVAATLEARAREVAELTGTLQAQETKLAAAQAAQAEVVRKARELEDARRELDLTVETRVAEAVAQVREKAKAEAEEGLRLRLAERDMQITALTRQIDELKRRAEQGSQQLQGEVLELELEAALRARFPADAIEPVAKGESGADVVQRVAGPGGQACGAMLWEGKRTRHFSDGWLPKLRADQRALGAEIALLVTEALPKGVERFELIDGIWVSDWKSALPLAVALRQSLIELAQAKAARAGQGTKMELVYGYLTGPRFRHRVEAIVERFRDMHADLEREKKATTRLWAKREMQIQGVIEATVGMYGDLQGIAGSALQEIDGLELPLLDAPDGE